MKRYLTSPVVIVLMLLGLLIFQTGKSFVTAFIGMGLFGLMALARPDLALVMIPTMVPLYLMPSIIREIRDEWLDPFLLPTFEIATLTTFMATIAHCAWRLLVSKTLSWPRLGLSEITALAKRYAPNIVWAVAALIGLLIAAERSRALREFRWMVVEPLLFYGMIQLQAWLNPDQRKAFLRALITSFAVTAAVVGLIGLLQIIGLDPAPLIGRKRCQTTEGAPCPNVIYDGSIVRVLSVYGHPNNMALFVGRIWPLAAAMGLLSWSIMSWRKGWMYFGLAALALIGMLVSFSRGGWLGTAVALLILAYGALIQMGVFQQRSLIALLKLRSVRLGLLGVVLVVIALAAFTLTIRGNIFDGSTPIRILLWQEAFAYIVRHPFGIGLDQFGFYHDPNNPELSLIHPSLIGTSEQFASHPHTMLLDLWLRVGPLGLFAFLWLIVRFFRRMFAAAQKPGIALLAYGALAAMAAALVHGQVDHFYFVSDLAFVFWFLIVVGEAPDEALLA
jgi:putative inorganic carbon (HCO3(-)) transporter